METKQADRAHDLAMRIYVELMARNTELTHDSVKLTTNASNVATLSLRLADAFLEAEEAAIVAREPTKAKSLESGDFAAWLK